MERIKNFFLKNSNVKQTVIKNTFWLLFSEITSRLMRMAFVIYAARILGANGWGVFSYALSIGSIFMIFSDIGTGDLMTREISQKKEGYQILASSILAVKGVILIISIVLLIFIGPQISNIAQAKPLLPIIALLFFFDTLRNLAFAINRAYEKMEKEMISKVVMSIVVIVVGILLLKIGLDAKSIAIAYAIGSGIGLLVIVMIIKNEIKGLIYKVNKVQVISVIKIISPFIIVTIFTTIIANADIFMLGIWKNAKEIGLYTSVQRIQQFVLIIPSMIATATFPFMAQAAKNIIQFRISLEKTLLILMAIGLPVALIGIFLSDQIVLLLFGSGYIEAISVLSILMSTLLIYFPLIILSNVIFALNYQKYLVVAYGFGAISNILLNILFIPRHGAIGAAIAVLVSNIVVTFFLWQKIKKIIYFKVLSKLKKIILASSYIVLVLIILKHFQINVIVNLLLSFLIYVWCLILLKEPVVQELRKIIKI